MAVALGVLTEGKRLPIPDDVAPVYQEIMRDCWKQDPADRPTMKEVHQRLHAHYNKLAGIPESTGPKSGAGSHSAPPRIGSHAPQPTTPITPPVSGPAVPAGVAAPTAYGRMPNALPVIQPDYCSVPTQPSATQPTQQEYTISGQYAEMPDSQAQQQPQQPQQPLQQQPQQPPPQSQQVPPPQQQPPSQYTTMPNPQQAPQQQPPPQQPPPQQQYVDPYYSGYGTIPSNYGSYNPTYPYPPPAAPQSSTPTQPAPTNYVNYSNIPSQPVVPPPSSNYASYPAQPPPQQAPTTYPAPPAQAPYPPSGYAAFNYDYSGGWVPQQQPPTTPPSSGGFPATPNYYPVPSNGIYAPTPTSYPQYPPAAPGYDQGGYYQSY